jgi:hypothetical protein
MEWVYKDIHTHTQQNIMRVKPHKKSVSLKSNIPAKQTNNNGCSYVRTVAVFDVCDW